MYPKHYSSCSLMSGLVQRDSASDFPLGGAVDSGPAGGQHRLCGGALPQVSLASGGAAQLPQDRAKPGHQERGMHLSLHLGSQLFIFPTGLLAAM